MTLYQARVALLLAAEAWIWLWLLGPAAEVLAVSMDAFTLAFAILGIAAVVLDVLHWC